MVSNDAKQALTEFSTEFDAAYATAEPGTWADLGLVYNSKAIRTVFPLPISAAGYHKLEGDPKYRDLFERSVEIEPVEWQDGVSALSRVIEAPDFIGWGKEPGNIAREGKRQPLKLVATMLHANPLLDFYRVKLPGGSQASTIRLFAGNHPVNVTDAAKGTFDNDHTVTGIDEATISACKLRFSMKKAPNGEPAGLEFNTLLVPAALSEQAKKFFESDTLLLAVENAGGEIVGGVTQNNRFKGTVNVIVCPELLDADIMYALDSNSGAYPWILQDGGAPEEIRFDKDSDFWKTTRKVAISYVLTMSAVAALPLAIERLTIA